MELSSIPYSKLPKTSSLFLDYVSRFERVAQFYNGSPYQPASYSALATKMKFGDEPRRRIAEILTAQNKAFGSSAATFDNIARLARPGTFAVVTGQQVGLLGGPAFTLYKALTAVKLAQTLTERGLEAVPVFWLATEDHDLEEVARTATLDDELNLIDLKDSGDRPAPHSPVGRVKFTEQISAALGTIENTLPPGPSRDQLLRDLRECYQPGALWGNAFGRFLARVFSKWGVALLDPMDEGVDRLRAHIFQEILSRAGDLKQHLQKRSETLVQSGYDAQVFVGEDSTLVFAAREGNRTALHERGGQFFFDGPEAIPEAELKKLAANQPLAFSPNALLRPFVQDTLLPTIAYVAGPSELAYLAQSQVIYTELGRPQPVIFPRAGFTLVDARSKRLMEKYRVALEDVWQGEEHLRRTIAANGFAEGWSERLDETEASLTQLLEKLRKDVEAIDPTLLDTLKRTEEKMKYQVDQLKGKISRAALGKSELLARHEQALIRLLFPRRQLQEREVSGAYFLGRAGYELLDRLLAHIQIESSHHLVVDY
ncbi:MAG TPA: bacillithiol biosynthesis cysteine-adding enzyme BshC [Terriglobia bacterium]|nr:bacillithiol biosynthesis cysteine-adding enzyme BshC [Terriglobia bacterium]